MNKRRKDSRRSVKNSPVLFDDEEIGTSSPDEVKVITPTTKSNTGHSTPVRRKADLSDIPDLSYSESPIEQLTQNPPNEVEWDYHRPFTKEEDSKSTFTGLNRTPKRNPLLSKKRNSNSPLLYKPLKKKLHEEHKDDVAGFMQELQAIAINIKLNGERNSENLKKTEDEVESQLVVELESQPSDESDIRLQISNNTDESLQQNNAVTKNDNYEALLNDSMENAMVVCSQEVEKEFNRKRSPLGSNILRDKVVKISPDTSLEKMFKENLQPVHETEKSTESSSKYSPVSKEESCSSEIPDDSFDQFFTEIDDKELCKNIEINISDNSTSLKTYAKGPTASTMSNNTTSSNKFFHTKSAVPTLIKTQSNIFSNHDSQEVKVSVQNKVINSNASFGYLNKGYVKNESSGFGSHASSSSGNSETRFLKAKSFSGSNVSSQSNSTNSFMSHNSRSISNLNVNAMKGQKNVISIYSMSENKGWRRTNSGSSIGQSSINNITQNSVNKIGNSGSQTHFTPEEIERKRLEALSRREAKKKYNSTMTRTTYNPVKR